MPDTDTAVAGNGYQLNREQRRGFKRDRKTYRLRFETPDLAGLEVTATSLPLGDFLKLADLADIDIRNPESLRNVGGLFEVFAGSLVSWNLIDEDDQPIPATLEGVRAQDIDFVLPIIEEWMKAVAGVSGPLGQRSTGGALSAVASLPMEPSSPSQPS